MRREKSQILAGFPHLENSSLFSWTQGGFEALFSVPFLRKGKLWGPRIVTWILLLFALFPGMLAAGELTELRHQKDLTPESFIRQFADFAYELRDTVQEPARFLARKRGDCDDFARLAALILGERGYQTKIVVVMMERETHVVCHVTEAGGFLDFNHRKRTVPVVKSDGSLEDIAQRVAGDFRCKWRMVSEIRYEGSQAVFLDNVFYSPRDRGPSTVDVEIEPPITGEKTEIAAGAAVSAR